MAKVEGEAEDPECEKGKPEMLIPEDGEDAIDLSELEMLASVLQGAGDDTAAGGTVNSNIGDSDVEDEEVI